MHDAGNYILLVCVVLRAETLNFCGVREICTASLETFFLEHI